MADVNSLKVDTLDGRPIVIVHETGSGVIAHITPLSTATIRAMQLKAADEFPYPDPKPYEVAEDADVAFAEGQVTPADKNPDYVKLCKEVDLQRAKFTDRLAFDYAVTFPKYPTSDDIVSAFKLKLDKLRKIAKLDDESDYELTLFHLILTGNTGVPDYIRLVQLAYQMMPLAPAEVANEIRYFRLKV